MNPNRTMAEALACHGAGRLREAGEIYREILARHPQDADALHLLGVIAFQGGDNDQALALISKAVNIRPGTPVFLDNLGLVLARLGRLEDAEQAHRKALALDDGLACAHNNLGAVLRAAGDMSGAEAAHRRALELDPGNVGAHNNLGNVLAVSGRAGEAEENYRQALTLNPDFPMALSNLGSVLRGRGNLDEAEALCRRAVDLSPDYAQGWNNLGNILMAREQVDEAVTCFRRAVEIHPGFELAWSNLGSALVGLGLWEEAKRAFHQAIKADPRCAEAHNGLGVLEQNLGRAAAAHACFCQAVRLKPDYVDALYNLSHSKGFVFDPEKLGRIEALLEGGGLGKDDCAKLHFALAEHALTLGRHDAAFEQAAKGNAARGLGFDPAAWDGAVDDLMARYSEDFFQARQDYGVKSEIPVFVLGMPRSGTTLVEQILASHPSVHGAGELKDMARIAQRTEMDGEASRDWGGRYVATLRKLAPHAERVIDKMPFNFLHVGLIALILPQARIVQCVRDPLDVGVSCFFQNFSDPHPWSTDLNAIGRYYRSYERLMAHWKTVLPGRIHEIGYENLVRDQEGESRRLIGFLGLPWDDRCLAFHETERPVRTASNRQVREPVYTGSMGRYRAFARHLEPLKRGLEGKGIAVPTSIHHL